MNNTREQTQKYAAIATEALRVADYQSAEGMIVARAIVHESASNSPCAKLHILEALCNADQSAAVTSTLATIYAAGYLEGKRQSRRAGRKRGQPAADTTRGNCWEDIERRCREATTEQLMTIAGFIRGFVR